MYHHHLTRISRLSLLLPSGDTDDDTTQNTSYVASTSPLGIHAAGLGSTCSGQADLALDQVNCRLNHLASGTAQGVDRADRHS